MHSSEQKQQFVLLRSQGWSLARIAGHLDIPKGTLWRWDHEKHDQLQVLKAVRFEEIQEKFIPTYEEELQQLAAYRDRIRKVLQHQDFGWMKPEFLLKMDLQITSRLAKFRAELPLHDLPKTDPVSLPGCVSRDELKPDAAPVASHPADQSRANHASAPAEMVLFGTKKNATTHPQQLTTKKMVQYHFQPAHRLLIATLISLIHRHRNADTPVAGPRQPNGINPPYWAADSRAAGRSSGCCSG